ncbi:cysteine-rich PDZ-binding protein isoform 1-T1 [Ciconia maguari]
MSSAPIQLCRFCYHANCWKINVWDYRQQYIDKKKERHRIAHLNRLFTGEKKLGTVITPDTWKDGARNTTESGGRKLNENKALTSKKARFDPYGKNKFAICRICKSSVHQPGSHYCQGCAYKKGICSMCGKKVLDTKNYKQTSV